MTLINPHPVVWMDQVYPPGIHLQLLRTYFHFPEIYYKGRRYQFQFAVVTRDLLFPIFLRRKFSSCCCSLPKKIPYLGFSDETKDGAADSGV